jgi:DNA-binding IclR family transcriptional regulator
VERLHVHYLRELVHRLRAGASQRAIAHDLGLARMTVHKYAQLAAAAGYLDASRPLPDAAALIARLGPPVQPPRTPSSVEPYREQVEQLLNEGVEMMTIFDRINQRGYTGGYSSVRRFVRTLKPGQIHSGGSGAHRARRGGAG